MLLHARVNREDGWFVAQCVEVEVASQGKTVDESLANLKEALELYFEDLPTPTDLPLVQTLEISA